MPPGGRRPSRNDPCPCGSGKKYKHCCMPGADAEWIALPRGRMILGANFAGTPSLLEALPDDDPRLYVENLAAVARALAGMGATDVAAEAYRRLVSAVEAEGLDEFLDNALPPGRRLRQDE